MSPTIVHANSIATTRALNKAFLPLRTRSLKAGVISATFGLAYVSTAIAATPTSGTASHPVTTMPAVMQQESYELAERNSTPLGLLQDAVVPASASPLYTLTAQNIAESSGRISPFRRDLFATDERVVTNRLRPTRPAFSCARALLSGTIKPSQLPISQRRLSGSKQKLLLTQLTSPQNQTSIAPAAPATNAPKPAVAPPVAAPIVTPAAAGILRNAQGEPLVSNVFSESDLKQALADVSAQTGVTIIADNSVQGSVTAELKDVPLERALSILLRGGGYSFVKVDDYYVAGAAEPSNPNFSLFSRTEVVTLRHARPETILSFLELPYGRFLSIPGSSAINRSLTGTGNNDNFSRRSISGFGNGVSSNTVTSTATVPVGAPPENYRIAITAPSQMMERIKADITRLDSPRPQVMLEAYVLEISEERAKNFGLNFATRYFSLNTNPNNGNGSGGTGNTFSYSSIANTELVQINALVQNGAARLRANPRVTTADGQTAEVEVGQENYFALATGNASFQVNTLEVIKSGILLRITPRILEAENEVTALVEPEVRDVTGQGPNGLPQITFRRAATNVRVRDGESIVIGGLINEFDSKTNSRVPILGNLPVVGGLFRGTSSRKLRTETIIIITPRILRDDIVRDGVKSPILQQDLMNYRDETRRSPQIPAPVLQIPVAP